MKDSIYTRFATAEQSHSTFSLELLRDVLIPNLLGKDLNGITYWAGKDLARQFRIANPADLVVFFDQAGWGDLVLLKEKESSLDFQLSGEPVNRRLQAVDKPDFMLETGFLAEQTQLQYNRVSEAEIISQKKGVINIRVTIDQGQVVENNDPQEPLKIQRPAKTEEQETE